MTDTATTADEAAPETSETKAQKEEGPFWKFALKLLLAVFIFRSFLFSAFTIPSESMLPALTTGDYLFASKWPYGYTKHSLPFSLPLIPGRILADDPERGDVAVFKHPVDGTDYIKRVIGLPGDRIQMRNGELIINDVPVPKRRVEDFLIPITPNTQCHELGTPTELDDGTPACRYTQFEETLPGGKTYRVLDFGRVGRNPRFDVDPDETDIYVVPDGHVFMMGDNRDNSLDSRFSAQPGAGVGYVPQDLLLGRASMVAFSTDGSANWLLPWTWFTAARWDRIGNDI